MYTVVVVLVHMGIAAYIIVIVVISSKGLSALVSILWFLAYLLIKLILVSAVKRIFLLLFLLLMLDGLKLIILLKMWLI